MILQNISGRPHSISSIKTVAWQLNSRGWSGVHPTAPNVFNLMNLLITSQECLDGLVGVKCAPTKLFQIENKHFWETQKHKTKHFVEQLFFFMSDFFNLTVFQLAALTTPGYHILHMPTVCLWHSINTSVTATSFPSST